MVNHLRLDSGILPTMTAAPPTDATVASPADDTEQPALALTDGAVPAEARAVIVGVVQAHDGAPRLAPGAAAVDAALSGRLLAALLELGARGRPGEIHRVATLGLAAFPLVVATGLGHDPSTEAVRRAVGAAVRCTGDAGAVHIAIDAALDAVAEGALLGSYTYLRHKSQVSAGPRKTFTVAAGDDESSAAVLRRSRAVGRAVALARDLVNTPPNHLYPATFAQRATVLARRAGLTVEELGPAALSRGRYGAIIAVGRGSRRTPRLLRMSYRHPRPTTRIAFVGKGVTFDSGGLNLKTANLPLMKSDMGGGAAVIAATLAAAELQLPVEIIATVPMVENMPSGSAYRPSDVLVLHDGSTVEVIDTDSEGRLILADAILRAIEDKPRYLVETSTLTGGQVIALGPSMIGAMGQPAFRDRVVAAGTAAGEASWAMPLPDELRPGLDSDVADIANTATDGAATMLVAARFLATYIPPGLPWVHLDIAGPSWNEGAPYGYTPTGATGSAVRTLIAVATMLAGRDGTG
jgi:leucyl aminopeptidase